MELRRKLDKFIADNAEEWDVKNTVRAATLDLSPYPREPCLTSSSRGDPQRRMLEESQTMIADSAKRLGQAAQELRELLVSPDRGR